MVWMGKVEVEVEVRNKATNIAFLLQLDYFFSLTKKI